MIFPAIIVSSGSRVQQMLIIITEDDMDNRTNVKQEEPTILKMFDEKLEEARCLNV